MGLHFGQLHKLRGIVFYRLSPFEQRAFAGIFNPGFGNTLRRISENFFIVTPPFVASYLVYDWAEKTHKEMSRKNPADYADDK